MTFPDTLTTQGLSLWSLNIVGGEILTFPDTLITQGLFLWSLNIVGGEILTFPDTSLTTQGLSLWSLNIVGGEILTIGLPRHSQYSGVIPMVFEHSGGRDFDLPRHSHYSGVIPMVFEHSAPDAGAAPRPRKNANNRSGTASATGGPLAL